MERITLEEYFGPYLSGGEDTPAMRANAAQLLDAVNAALEAAIADGVPLMPNPVTGSYVSGDGHGGFRDSHCTVGAKNSRHRSAQAVDIYDPMRRLAAWAVQHGPRLIALGLLGMERPEWTPTWVHWQSPRVASGTWCFIPSSAAPAAAQLPEQLEVAKI